MRFEDVHYIRFFDKVDSEKGSEGCWPWLGHMSENTRYPNVTIQKRTISAHKLCWMIFHGGREVPEGMCVLHNCGNNHCVNPEHLRLGTHRDNAADRLRHRKTVKGEAVNTSKLTRDDVFYIRRAYERGDKTQVELARQFEIAQPSVSAIILGKNWKHLL